MATSRMVLLISFFWALYTAKISNSLSFSF